MYDTPISSNSDRESLFHKPSRESMECFGTSSKKYGGKGGERQEFFVGPTSC